MGQLYLVGTVHTDPDGAYRLDRGLEALSPRNIFVEISADRAKDILASSLEKRLAEHEATMDRWTSQGFVLDADQRQRLLELAAFKNKDYGYEVARPFDYQSSHPDVQVHYVDVSSGSRLFRWLFTYGLRRAMGMHDKGLTPEVKASVLKGLESPFEEHVANVRYDVERDYQRAEAFAEYFQIIGEDKDFFASETATMPRHAVRSFRKVIDPRRNQVIADGIRKKHGDGVSVGIMGVSHLYLVADFLIDLQPSVNLLNEVPVPDVA